MEQIKRWNVSHVYKEKSLLIAYAFVAFLPPQKRSARGVYADLARQCQLYRQLVHFFLRVRDLLRLLPTLVSKSRGVNNRQ